MRTLLLIAFILTGSINSFAQDEKLFAKIENDSVYIIYDTAKFKADILELVFNDYESKPVFESVNVVKKAIIGDSTNFYYSINLIDNSGTIKVAKWLEQRGTELYMIDKSSQPNSLKTNYITCIGSDECTPSVLMFEGRLGWSCGKSAVCTPESNCKMIKTIMM